MSDNQCPESSPPFSLQVSMPVLSAAVEGVTNTPTGCDEFDVPIGAGIPLATTAALQNSLSTALSSEHTEEEAQDWEHVDLPAGEQSASAEDGVAVLAELPSVKHKFAEQDFTEPEFVEQQVAKSQPDNDKPAEHQCAKNPVQPDDHESANKEAIASANEETTASTIAVVTLAGGPAAVIDNVIIACRALNQFALQESAKLRAIEQQRLRHLAEEQQQTELTRAMQSFTVTPRVNMSHSTYSPDRLGAFGSGFSNVGSPHETYTGNNSGRMYSTGSRPPQGCFNCGEMHWRKDCPRGHR